MPFRPADGPPDDTSSAFAAITRPDLDKATRTPNARQMANPYKAGTAPAHEASSSSTSSALVYEPAKPDFSSAYLAGASSRFLAQLARAAVDKGVDQDEFVRVVHETALKTKDVGNPLTARRRKQASGYYTAVLHHVYKVPLNEVWSSDNIAEFACTFLRLRVSLLYLLALA